MATAHEQHYYVKCSAHAELSGFSVDISSFNITYAVNEIPTASFTPVLGKEPTSGASADAVAQLMGVALFDSVKIYANLTTQQDNPTGDSGFPYGSDVLLFDGYFTGMSYKSMRSPAGGAVMLEINATSWLSGLAGSDTLTGVSSVRGPGGFAEVANTKANGFGLFDIDAAIFPELTGATTDLWRDFIKEMFLEIIDNPSVWGDSPNDAARDALNRMDGSGFGGVASNELALAFGEGVSDREVLGKFLASAIARPLYYNWRRGNMWSSLLTMANEFMFQIVPLIETASCVPAYGALSGQSYKTIYLSDYYDIYMQAGTPTKFTRYVLVGEIDNISSSADAEPRVGGVVGFHDLDPALNGLTLVTSAPLWLAAETTIGKLTKDSVGGSEFEIPDAANPEAFTGEPEDDYQALYNTFRESEIGNNFAKAAIQQLSLLHRHGTISGRFRLDIAPGSTIEFEALSDEFDESSPVLMYGMIDKVVLNMTSGDTGATGSASTEYHMSYVRTEAEHNNPDITNAEHPLYQNTFIGASLWN